MLERFASITLPTKSYLAGARPMFGKRNQRPSTLNSSPLDGTMVLLLPGHWQGVIYPEENWGGGGGGAQKVLDKGETVMGQLLFITSPGELNATEESWGARRCLGVWRHIWAHWAGMNRLAFRSGVTTWCSGHSTKSLSEFVWLGTGLSQRRSCLEFGTFCTSLHRYVWRQRFRCFMGAYCMYSWVTQPVERIFVLHSLQSSGF